MSSRLSHEIAKRWDLSFKKVEVSGLTSSAKAYLLADLLSTSNKRLAIVCSNPEKATQMHQDIKAFLNLNGTKGREKAWRVDFFPGWEHSPYQALNPSIKNRLKRLKTLTRVASGELQGLVTSVAPLCQRATGLFRLSERSVTLKPGHAISREDLITRLESAGYMRHDTAEDPGCYAVRGSLFDIFSPSSPQPYRLDFFDDTLETIRLYDPASQRSSPASQGEATIIPVSELEFTPQAISAAKIAIKGHCDEHGIHKRARDSIFEKLDSGIRDPAFDYLSPFFATEPLSWLPEALDESWTFIIDDFLGVEAAYDELRERLRKDFEQSLSRGQIAAPVDKLYASPVELSDVLKSRVELQLDQVSLSVPDMQQDADAEEEKISPKMKINVINNEDLKKGDHQRHFLDAISAKSRLWLEKGYRCLFMVPTKSQADRTHFLLEQKSLRSRLVEGIDWNETSVIQICEGAVSAGFRLPSDKLAVITDAEIFGPKKKQAEGKKHSALEINKESFSPSLGDLRKGDFIVHNIHGIGKYHGLTKLAIDRITHDFLLIEYADADKLYLPVYRLDQVQRYIGDIHAVALDKLGTTSFEKTKEKVKADLQALAHHLLQLYARRASRAGFAFSPPDESYREFESQFPYAETADQLRAIEDVAQDMASEKIMDRLVCGDVGYGKTEVAMRAAFRAAADGKQVAVLVPTTLLALQHEQSFRQRFKDAPLPFHIAGLSRFKTPKQAKDVLNGLKQGQVDIVIGTHRLLSKDVAFKDLGLLIVDEEQRFGVEHKERLKNLKVNTDVLTLTATPIPRTLHMSLMGMRDISIINTPPADRLSVRTYVARFDEAVIQQAIRQELARGGQVFFLHNRVQTIHEMADRLGAIVPEAKILVAHGQLEERQLEEKMLQFYNKEANVLLCSTIIESGLDIPSANTMIISRADMFGLAQLYQLRGRVGRSQARAYCYLLLPEEGAVTEDAKKRLEILQRFVDLGSGFKIASHDLELRGGGDLLGKSQSGQIAAVGYELYTELLDEAIREQRGQPIEDHFDPEIKVPAAALLPEPYVPDVQQRLNLYKRLSQSTSNETLHDLEIELQDRFGPLPAEVQNLLWLIRLKQALRRFHIQSIVAGTERIAIDVGSNSRLSPEKILKLVQADPKKYSITPDSKLVLKSAFQSVQLLFHELEKLLSQVAEAEGPC